MSKDLNTSNLALNVPYRMLVPVLKGQLNKTIRKAKIKLVRWMQSFNPLTPKPAITSYDEHWPFFHF